MALIFGFSFWRSWSIFDDFMPEESNVERSAAPDEEDREMSKQDLIDYFVQEVTTYPNLEKKVKLARWDKDTVTLSIEDDKSEAKIKAVDNFITTFNKNSNYVKLKRTDSNGDIKIYFQEDTSGSAGRSGPGTGADYIIDLSYVEVSQDAAIFEQSLNQVFSHEMFHALGFTGHYSGSVCRLMSPDVCGSHISVNEEKLIQMLYATDIPPGLDESQIREYFKNWQP